MNNFIIIANKPYNNIELNDIIDIFNNNIRCNMAIPNINNGTKIDKYILNIHIYANLLEAKLNKKEFIKYYKDSAIKENIENFYDFFHKNKNILKCIKQDNRNYDNFLRSIGCPYSVNKNGKIASCGYNAIFETIHCNIKPFVFGYGLNINERQSYYHIPKDPFTRRQRTALCHDAQMEIQTLIWLHNNNNIDITMCLLEDKELPTFDCNKIKPKKDILLLFLKKYGIVILKNFYPEKILNEIINETDNIFNNYKDKINILDKDNSSNYKRIFNVERYSSYINTMYSNNRLFNKIAIDYTNHKLNNKRTIINKLLYDEDKKKNNGIGWHRDNHNIQLKTIMYLSDVTERNGNFQFITNSSKKHIGYPHPITPDNDNIYNDNTIEQLLIDNKSSKLHNIIGSKGTIIIVDTTYIHKGNIIEEDIRNTITEYYI